MTICKNLNCNRDAYFNLPDKKPHFCSTHKTNDMINVKTKRCRHIECESINPSFNVKSEKVGMYCATHKTDDMVDIKNKRCKYPGCESLQPVFNIKGQTIGIYCATHKTDDMINVVSPKCKYLGCESPGPCFNVNGHTIGEYCGTHKTDVMINVVSPRCTLCHLFVVQKKGGLCSYCNPISTKTQKTKEMQIKSLLEKHNIKFIHNKGVSNDCCFRYIPDFMIECTTKDNIYYIVLEVDEFAHKGYDPVCEVTRMNNISVSLDLPTKFIRYNPDLKGISKKIKEETLITRLKQLINNFDNDITAEYLFYP